MISLQGDSESIADQFVILFTHIHPVPSYLLCNKKLCDVCLLFFIILSISLVGRSYSEPTYFVPTPLV